MPGLPTLLLQYQYIIMVATENIFKNIPAWLLQRFHMTSQLMCTTVVVEPNFWGTFFFSSPDSKVPSKLNGYTCCRAKSALGLCWPSPSQLQERGLQWPCPGPWAPALVDLATTSVPVQRRKLIPSRQWPTLKWRRIFLCALLYAAYCMWACVTVE